MNGRVRVPIVDIASSDAAASLAASLASLGFVQIVGHGLDTGCSVELRSQCDLFFDLSAEQKSQWVHPAPEANRGYRAKGSEALSYSLGEPSPPDLFESFNCGSNDRVTDSPLIQPTPWPATVPEFETVAHRYLDEMARISSLLDALVGSWLDMDLEQRSRTGPDTMACIDYRPRPDGTEAVVDGQQRMGAHSDYTTFTILNADAVPGLQIVDESGNWGDVIPEPGALLINVGDVLAMLTNDAWPSTLHRVVPMSAGAAAVRRSIAYFHYPELDFEIAPLPRFVRANPPARYQPVTVEQHLLGKLTAPKTHDPATAASTAANRLGDRG